MPLIEKINPEFKKYLLTNFGYKPKVQKNLERIVRFGAWGEAGDSHYIFIYRTAMESDVSYESILFLYNPMNTAVPLDIKTSTRMAGNQQNNIFALASVFFLEEHHPNTMELKGPIEMRYKAAQKAIREHYEGIENKKKKLEDFDFTGVGNPIRYTEEIPGQFGDTGSPDPEIVELLEKLELIDSAGEIQYGKSGELFDRSPARPGFCLVVPESSNKALRFQPVMVPVKRDGTDGVARPAVPSSLKQFTWETQPQPIYSEYLNQLIEFSNKRTKDPIRLEILNQLYFERLVPLMFKMPPELIFTRFEDDRRKDFHPVKILKIKSAKAVFAPLPGGIFMRVVLVLTDTQGRQWETWHHSHPMTTASKKAYILFTQKEEIDRYYFAVPEEPEKFYKLFRLLSKVKRFSSGSLNYVRHALVRYSSDRLSINTAPLRRYRLEFRPSPVLKIRKPDSSKRQPANIVLDFDYQSGLDRFRSMHPDKLLVDAERNHDFEKRCKMLVKQDPLLTLQQRSGYWDGYNDYFALEKDGELKWLRERGNFYIDKGFKIYSERFERFVGKTGSTLKVEMEHGPKWMEFKPMIKDPQSGKTLSVGSVDLRGQTVTDIDGNLHMMQPEDAATLEKLAKYADRRGTGFRVPAGNFFLIDKLYDKRMEQLPELKEKLLSARNLDEFERIPEYSVSSGFKGKLRKYQLTGFRWLMFLHQFQLNGCLADDMGLGKTVQALALLHTLKQENKLKTSLLVVPVSAVPNWEMEIKRFTPGITSYRYMGTERTHDADEWKKYDLIITSYATLRNDVEQVKDFSFDYIILDESQNIKNFASLTAKSVKILKSGHRLALSGTPIENNSMELWSLFDFIMPGFLGTNKWFNNRWAVPVEKYKDESRAEILKKMIYPFIMRRRKGQVERQLPPKIEIVERLDMATPQMALYVQTARAYTRKISEAIEEKGVAKSSLTILEGMLRLRQICLFPGLVDPDYEEVPSAKFRHFTELVEDILAEGHKVLVFSQFVKVLDYLRLHLEEKTVDYAYLDGSVPVKKREKLIVDFQETDKYPVFLLSLKAGGVALNLTAADYVIIFDPWWNPAVEAQAVDRSHRIGQKRKVIVYRMVVKDSIEEKMLKLQEKKKQLVEQLISSDTSAFKNLKKDDILNLFQFSG